MEEAPVIFQGFKGLMDRYKDWFESAEDVVTLGEGSTPLIRAFRLEKHLGFPEDVRLWLKLESLNPTGSFKDRGMTVAVTRAVRSGVRTVVCASTGNTAASAAAYAARAGLDCFVLVPANGVAPGKFAQVAAFGASVLEIRGNFDKALQVAVQLCNERDDMCLVNSLNPDRIDGQRTAAFEVCDALQTSPAAVLLPVGNAANITAYWRGFREYREAKRVEGLPRMFGVQAEGAAPLVRGEVVEHPQTAASAIRIGSPASRRGAELAVEESNGAFWAVSDEMLYEARDLLGRLEGIYVELASAAGIAALLADRRRLFAHGVEGGDVVCVLTGNGLKEPQNVASPRVIPCDPVLDSVLAAIDKSFQKEKTF